MSDYKKFEKYLESEINNKRNQLEYFEKEVKSFPKKQLLD
jgi:hypothetical protein